MKTKLVQLLTLVAIAAGAAACDSDSPTQPPVFVGPANLVITDLQIGTGATVAAGQRVNANYALWLYDPSGTDNKGTQIPSSTPATFTLSPNSIIQGWVDGVPGMKVGGRRRLIVPPSLAYGAAGNPPAIPGNAWIVFDIEILAIVP